MVSQQIVNNPTRVSRAAAEGASVDSIKNLFFADHLISSLSSPDHSLPSDESSLISPPSHFAGHLQQKVWRHLLKCEATMSVFTFSPMRASLNSVSARQQSTTQSRPTLPTFLGLHSTDSMPSCLRSGKRECANSAQALLQSFQEDCSA